MHDHVNVHDYEKSLRTVHNRESESDERFCVIVFVDVVVHVVVNGFSKERPLVTQLCEAFSLSFHAFGLGMNAHAVK